MWVWEEVGHYSKVVRFKILCVSLQLRWIYVSDLWKRICVLFSDFILFMLLRGNIEMLTFYCARVMYTEINIMVLFTPSFTA